MRAFLICIVFARQCKSDMNNVLQRACLILPAMEGECTKIMQRLQTSLIAISQIKLVEIYSDICPQKLLSVTVQQFQPAHRATVPRIPATENHGAHDSQPAQWQRAAAQVQGPGHNLKLRPESAGPGGPPARSRRLGVGPGPSGTTRSSGVLGGLGVARGPPTITGRSQ